MTGNWREHTPYFVPITDSYKTKAKLLKLNGLHSFLVSDGKKIFNQIIYEEATLKTNMVNQGVTLAVGMGPGASENPDGPLENLVTF